MWLFTPASQTCANDTIIGSFTKSYLIVISGCSTYAAIRRWEILGSSCASSSMRPEKLWISTSPGRPVDGSLYVDVDELVVPIFDSVV